jgi:phosphatidylinositol-3-phosphatase
LALWSGSTQGVTDDGIYNLPGNNLVDELEAKGKSWQVFAQNVPLNCYTGATASGGEDGSGTYARKHEPAVSFTDTSGNAARCAKITDFSHFDPAAADYELIVPNLCNDMHDCSVAVGDSFLKGFIPTILNSAAWQQGGVLFLTWDEGSTSTNGGGKVATVVIAPTVPAGYTSSTAHNHYSLLHTIETAWGLGCLNNSCTANDLREFFP